MTVHCICALNDGGRLANFIQCAPYLVLGDAGEPGRAATALLVPRRRNQRPTPGSHSKRLSINPGTKSVIPQILDSKRWYRSPRT